MKETKKILLVADYGKDDLAFKEVQQRLYDLAQDAGLHIQVDIASVDAFNTAQTAALVAKAAESGRYDLVYHNTAPRRDKDKERRNNDGEGLAYAEVRAEDGRRVQVVGVNAGNEHNVNTFSLLGNGEIHNILCDTNGSQFRSRDVFPQEVIAALKGTLKYSDDPLAIPEPTDLGPVRDAYKQAAARWEDVGDQLLRHGDAARGYITLVGHKEVIQDNLGELHKHRSGAEIDALPLKSTRGESIEAGFAAAQLALNSTHPDRRTLIVLPEAGTDLDNATTLYDATLNNGAHIITSDVKALVFAKHHLGAEGVKAYAQDGRSVSIQDGAVTLSGNAKNVSPAELEAEAALPEHVTPAYTDGYGNIKLAMTHGTLTRRLGVTGSDGESTLKPNERCIACVSIGDKSADACVADGSFAVKNGDMALSKGSSGWPAAPGQGKDYFAEVFLRGGNAASELGAPQPGDPVRVARKQILQSAEPGRVTEGDTVEVIVPRRAPDQSRRM